MTNHSELQSRTIAFLRFPLIVGVVLIHTYFKEVVINGEELMEGGNFPVYSNIAYYLSEVLARIAVPLFFFISGYLFFFRTKDFGIGTYGQKLRKRARTILLPYVLWNCIYLLAYFLCENIVEGLLSGRNKPIADYSFTDFLWAFWDKGMINSVNGTAVDHYPIDYPLWFIRDLLVVMVSAPLLHALIRCLRHYFIILLGILWFSGYWFHITGLSLDAFFFFSAGAYFSINGRNFTDDFHHIFPYSLILYLVLSFSDLCLRSYTWDIYIHKAGIIVGIVAAISLVAWCLRQGKLRDTPFLSASSFFIYAFHALPLAFVCKLLFKILQPDNDWIVLFLYFFCPALTILGGLLLYWLLKKYFPNIAAILTGGR